MNINRQRLLSMLEEVNRISAEGEGVTRLAYTPEENAALDWFVETCDAHSIETRRDAMGNVFGTVGNSSGGGGILIGSHLDTVKEGGEYDGALGVVAGLEVLVALKENGERLDRPVTVVAFRGEEANILGGTFGSRAFCGLIGFDDAFMEKLEQTPFTEREIRESAGHEGYIDYLELHIEQGKSLENSGTEIGIVDAIAGIRRLDVTVYGEAAHSGTMAMGERDDALTHAAGLLLEFERIVNSFGAPYVGTVGTFSVHPNLANVVPGRVDFVLEVRGPDIEIMRRITGQFTEYAEAGHNVKISENVEKPPSALSDVIIEYGKSVCREAGIRYEVMMSGANHDANSLASVMNSGLIFIPCLNGVSHNPGEYAAPEDIVRGASVLLGTVMKLQAG